MDVLAHVDYVTAPTAPHLDPWRFALDTLSHPVSASLVAAAALVTVVAGLWLVLRRHRWDWERRLVGQLDGYRVFVPWILRLAAGLPLIGAGMTGTDFVPDEHGGPGRWLVLLGFMLLLGLLTRPAAGVALLLFAAAVIGHPHTIEAFEYVALLGGLVLTGGGRPSLDDLWSSSFPATVPGPRWKRHAVPWDAAAVDPWVGTVIRIGLGASLAFVGITEKLLDPGRSLAAVAHYNLTAVVPVDASLWVVGAGLLETSLGIALMLGLTTRVLAVAAFGVLTLTFFGLADDPVLAHVTLFGAASALFITGAGRLSLDVGIRRIVGRSPGGPAGGAQGADR
jgi:uncharacterized membrane protein YphA (DoxX/SURF4 family)